MAKTILSSELFVHCAFHREHSVLEPHTFGFFLSFMAQLSVISGRTSLFLLPELYSPSSLYATSSLHLIFFLLLNIVYEKL
jgi:hypothetical protein